MVAWIILVLIVVGFIGLFKLAFRLNAKIRKKATDKRIQSGEIVSRPSNFYNYAYLFAVKNADFRSVSGAMQRAKDQKIAAAYPDAIHPEQVLDFTSFRGHLWRAYLEFLQFDGERYVYQFGFSEIKTMYGIVEDADGMNALLTFVERTLSAMDPNLQHAQKPIERKSSIF